MKLKPICISRFYQHNYSLEEIKSVEMHGFSDASARVYASCIYLKFILYDGNTLVKFLCSKTRVNPLEKKFLTIPRLELMGCVLLSNLMKSCLESLKPTFLKIDVYCWWDSADCIYWINNNSKIWKQFKQWQIEQPRTFFKSQANQNPQFPYTLFLTFLRLKKCLGLLCQPPQPLEI